MTVVGHRHPTRESATSKTLGFESYLWTEFSQADSLDGLSSVKSEILKFLSRNEMAVKHWREDRDILEKALQANTHHTFAIEITPPGLQLYESHSALVYKNLAAAGPKMELSPSEIVDLQLVALTPTFFTKINNSNLIGDAKIITAEPTDEEVRAYDNTHCQKKPEAAASPFPPAKQEALERLLASLFGRGLGGSEISDALALAEKEILKMHEGLDVEGLKGIKDEDIVKIYVDAFPINLSSDELANLRIFCARNPSMDSIFDGLETDKIAENLPRLISDYRGCWGRDALIARNLAQQSQSTMMFIGIGHLAPQAALLKRECQLQLKK